MAFVGHLNQLVWRKTQLSQAAFTQQSWVCHWRDLALNLHSDDSSQSVSVWLSVCLSHTHTCTFIHTHSSWLAHILNPELLLRHQEVAAYLSGSKWNPPASQRSVPLAGGRLGSGLRPQRSQGTWQTAVTVRYPWGARLWLHGVVGAHEMPGCLPRCWLPGKTENSLSWVRMWTLLGICDFNQMFQKWFGNKNLITPAWFQIITMHMEWTSEF